MAACDSLSSLFKKPLPENPTLIESLSSWSQIMPQKPLDPDSFTEIFGELHFKEKPAETRPPLEQERTLLFDASEFKERDVSSNGCKLASMESLLGTSVQYRCDVRNNDSFPLKNSDPLQLCTEGLGSESSDDVDDLINEDAERIDIVTWKDKVEAEGLGSRGFSFDVRLRSGAFPPPITSIGRTGKPCICFKSYRQNGRFVLREIRIPTHEFLRASREDGRLKLHLVQPRNDDIPEGNETLENEEEDDEEDNEVMGDVEVDDQDY